MSEIRRRAEFNRAKRTLARANLLTTEAELASQPTTPTEESEAMAPPTVGGTSKGPKGVQNGWVTVNNPVRCFIQIEHRYWPNYSAISTVFCFKRNSQDSVD